MTFTNKRESNVSAAALVFELKSEITGRVADAIINHKCELYQSFDFLIPVLNKFTQKDYGEFQIDII